MKLIRNAKATIAESLVIGCLVAAASIAGLVLGAGGLYGSWTIALGPAPSTAGLLVPGLLGHDVFNLVLALPLLVATVWLARRAQMVALALWPGALFYLLYTYTVNLIGAPFSGLFLVYVAVVALDGYTTISIVATLDGNALRRLFVAAVPARSFAMLLVLLGLLTVAQDVSGVLQTALAGDDPPDPLARAVWTVDLSLEVPAMGLGGILLWRRTTLGFLVAPGLLLQYGLTPVALAFGVLLQALVAGSPVNWGTVLGVLGFAVACFAPLVYFARKAARPSAGPWPAVGANSSTPESLTTGASV